MALKKNARVGFESWRNVSDSLKRIFGQVPASQQLYLADTSDGRRRRLYGATSELCLIWIGSFCVLNVSLLCRIWTTDSIAPKHKIKSWLDFFHLNSKILDHLRFLGCRSKLDPPVIQSVSNLATQTSRRYLWTLALLCNYHLRVGWIYSRISRDYWPGLEHVFFEVSRFDKSVMWRQIHFLYRLRRVAPPKAPHATWTANFYSYAALATSVMSSLEDHWMISFFFLDSKTLLSPFAAPFPVLPSSKLVLRLEKATMLGHSDTGVCFGHSTQLVTDLMFVDACWLLGVLLVTGIFFEPVFW